MRAVFMGTPEFAVPSLLALIRAGHTVAAVYTQPDRPQGRKMLLTPPPVKQAALKENIPVLQPATLKGTAEAERIASFRPDVIALAAYGKMLPKTILEIPKYGCVNVHASLLPKYRGAAPVHAAILNGDRTTGVTTMQMAEGCDTGDILLVREVPVGPEETTPELTEKLSGVGADLLVRTLAELEAGTVVPKQQDDSLSSYMPMITKNMSPVNWNRTAQEIHDQIRGLYPWPAASCTIAGQRLKLYRSRVAADRSGAPGLAAEDEPGFVVCCGGGTALELLEVQTEGGRRMSGAEFLNGHPGRGTTMT